MNELAHGIEVGSLTVWSEPHHLVLVAIVRKAEILRQRLVEYAERMRKIHPRAAERFAPARQAPRRAGEIAKTVDRYGHGLLEGRHVKGRGQMREVMLDPVKRGAEALARKRPRQQFRNSRAATAIAQPREDQPRIRSMAQQIAKLADEVSPAVLIDRDVVHVTQTHPCLAQAIANRLRRKAGPVLHTAKSLLFGGGDEHAVAH